MAALRYSFFDKQVYQKIKTDFLSKNLTVYINYAIILYAFSIPISRAGISIFSVLMITLWVLQGDFKKKFHLLKNNKIILTLFLLILYGYISLFWTMPTNIMDGLHDITKTVRLIFLPLIVIATSLQRPYFSKIVTAFLFGMLISEIASYTIFFELIDPKAYPALFSGHASSNDPTPFMNHLEYSTFLAFTALILLHKYFYTYKLKYKILYFSYFLFIVSNLFINGGRTGQLAFLITIFISGLVHIKHKLIALIFTTIASLSIFFVAYNTSPVFQSRAYNASQELIKIYNNNDNMYMDSFGQRLGLWTLSLQNIEKYLFFGVGVSSNKTFIQELKETAPKKFQLIPINNTHNVFIKHLIMYGVFGLLLYISIWYFTLVVPIKHLLLSSLKLTFVLIYSIGSFFEGLFFAQFSMSFFALFVGVLIARNIRENNITNPLKSNT